MSRLNADSFDDPAWAIVTQGEKERVSGNFPAAIASSTRAMQSFSSDTPASAHVEALICRGAARGQSGEHQGAVEDFSSAIQINPKRDLAYYNRGYAHEQLKRFSETVDDYTCAIELRPNDADYYLRRGVCLKKLNKGIDANSDFAVVRQLTKRK